MKCISVWQPFASLLVKGVKVVETRSWPAPRSIIGQRIGIAATKVITSAQKAHWADPEFRAHYERLNMPDLVDLPRGHLLGTVQITASEVMTEELLADVTAEEQAYGHWALGNYAWFAADPVEFARPIAIRGKQGLYDWKGDISELESSAQPRKAAYS